MNFLSRNLGWILLFLFFLFMLFIISSNQEKAAEDREVNIELQGTGKTDTTDKQDEENMQQELDSLLNKISTDKLEEDQEVPTEISDEETTVNKDKDNTRTGFFGLFKKNQKSREDTSIEKESEEGASTDNMSADDTNLMKKTDSGEKVIISPSVAKYIGTHSLQGEFPGVNLESYIGKKYEIGVHSLKLNNAYFNKILAYMMKGDIIEQLTDENIHGCFQVKILNSVNIDNEGKVGYVCKKYLSDTFTIDNSKIENIDTEDSKVIEESIPEVIVKQSTPIYYTPNQEMFLQDKDFTQNLTLMDENEVLKKIGNTDERGCFEIKIVGTSEMHCKNEGLIGYVCEDSVSLYIPQDVAQK